jgi:hypothetical protein
MAVDSWVAAPPEEKAITFGTAEGIRFIEYGTNSILGILQGLVAIIFGVASQQMNWGSRSRYRCYYYHLCWHRGSLP